MKSKVLTLFIAGTSLLSMVGCSDKKVKLDKDIAEPTASHELDNNDLKMTHFAFNSSVLTEAGKSILKKNALALQEEPNTKIEAQGYCDDRGSIGYNLALGQRRAIAVKSFLETLGISGERITTVSFGKSNPLDPSDNERAWGMNRRASFVIQPKIEGMAFR